MQPHSRPDNKTQAELIEDLHSGTASERSAALERLALIGEADALDAVVEFLREYEPESFSEGLDTLNVLAHKFMPADRYSLADAVLPYLEVEDWRQRLTAVRLLNTHPNEIAVGVLQGLVDEAYDKVITEQRRRFSATRVQAERTLAEAILAMANCGRLLVLPDILYLIEDRSLRPVATRALGIIGSETERPRLEDLVEDPDPRVRDAAQWALSLMDERMEQFMNPPLEPPEPPPGRLHPVYWAHRQLHASEDDLLQFLVVRLAIEHILMDGAVQAGRVPENTDVILRRFDGQAPPDFRENDTEVISVWHYHWNGPALVHTDKLPRPEPAQLLKAGRKPWIGSSITVSYPYSLDLVGEGIVSCDSMFQPQTGRGTLYRVGEYNSEWSFALLGHTWAV